MNKYIEIFNDLVNTKGFKYAVDYMGTYFFGLLDNVNYYDFIEYYYNDFIDFTNWLATSADSVLFEQCYGDKEPMLYKLVDIIQETNEQPDSLQEALLKSFELIKDESKEPLYTIARDLISHKNQILMIVNVFDDGDEPLYNYEDKFSKVEQKNNPQMVIQNIVMTLALIVIYGGYVLFILREKGREHIYGFAGFDGCRIRTFSEDELEEITEDYVISQKDVEVDYNEYFIDKEKLN